MLSILSQSLSQVIPRKIKDFQNLIWNGYFAFVMIISNNRQDTVSLNVCKYLKIVYTDIDYKVYNINNYSNARTLLQTCFKKTKRNRVQLLQFNTLKRP